MKEHPMRAKTLYVLVERSDSGVHLLRRGRRHQRPCHRPQFFFDFLCFQDHFAAGCP
jgi:hypothetical protein